MSLSDYEQKALLEVEEHKATNIAKAPIRLVPESVRNTVRRAADNAQKMPGAEQTAAAVGAAYSAAAKGLGKAVARVARSSARPRGVVRRFSRRGHAVSSIPDIRRLDLEVVDGAIPFTTWTHSVAGMAAVEGAGAGAVITGGQTVAFGGGVAGAGAGAAPGAGVVAGALAADMATVLALSSALVSRIGLGYGYDTTKPAEEVFVMSVIGLGTATTQSAKIAAYRELSQLTALLARGAPWVQLNQHVLARLAGKFSYDFTRRELRKKGLGKVVPVAAVATGAGLNYVTIDRIGMAAYWAYRERFLREKLGQVEPAPEPLAPANGAGDDEEPPIDVLSLLDEAIKDERNSND